MRKLILLLTLFVCLKSYAQPSNYTNINGRYRWIAGVFDSTFHLPKGTSPSLRTGGWNSAGAMFYNTSDSSVYTYTGTQWLKLAGASGFIPYVGANQNVNLGNYGLKTDNFTFNTSPTAADSVSRLKWDADYGTLKLGLIGGNVSLQLGQEEVIRVHNNTGSELVDGDVVYINGSTGELPSVAKASASTASLSAVTIGVVTEHIAHGADGFVTVNGIVHGLNTNAYTEGHEIWLSTTAGQFTQTKPADPNYSVLIGYVVKKAGGNGSIYVNVHNGYSINDLNDVHTTSPVSGSVLSYNASTGVWGDTTLAAIGGITGSGTTNYVPKFTSSSAIGNSLIYDNGTNVGIGTTSPSEKLSIKSTDAAIKLEGTTNSYLLQIVDANNRLRIFDNTNNTERLTLTSTGNVGIGTSNPLTPLVVSANGYEGLEVTPVFNGVTYLTTYNRGGGAYNPMALEFSNLRFNPNGIEAMRLTSTGLGIGTTSPAYKLDVKANTSDYVAYINNTGGGSGLKIYNSDWDITDYLLYASNGGGYQVVIDGNGKLGIGTDSPATKLDISYADNAYSAGLTITNTTNNTSAQSKINIVNSAGTTLSLIQNSPSVNSGTAFISTSSTNALTFGVNYTEAMRITSGGEVLVGTTSSIFSSSGRGVLEVNGSSNSIIGVNVGNAVGAYLYSGSSNSELYSTTQLNFAVNGSTRMSITTGGNVLVGTSSNPMTSNSDATLMMSVPNGNDGISIKSNSNGSNVLNIWQTGTSGANAVAFYKGNTQTSVGSIGITTTGTSYNIISDYRLKEDFKSFNGLALIDSMNVYDYQWKIDSSRAYGVKAHELQAVIPYAVTGEKDGKEMQQVDYSKLVPVLIEAVKELNAKITNLEAEINNLKNK